jgi:two-component system, OmpR family, response regulator MprA
VLRPDALDLDVLMPQRDGREVCRNLRTAGDDLPVLMLTVRGRTDQVVAGFDAGADDYLTKPFAVAELLARLEGVAAPGPAAERAAAVPRPGARPGLPEGQAGDPPRVAHDDRARAARRAPAPPGLGALPPHPLRAGLGYDYGLSSNTLDVYVGYLRRKLEAGGQPRLVHTVRGVGYVLRRSTDDRGRPA